MDLEREVGVETALGRRTVRAMNLGVWEIILVLFLFAPIIAVAAVGVWFYRASKNPKRQMEKNKILHEGVEYPKGERPGPERRKLEEREARKRQNDANSQRTDTPGKLWDGADDDPRWHERHRDA